MELSLFDVVGPVMIGPSSSHTAGAARLARVARQIAGEFTHVSFGLHGSFAKTGWGHGTDRALVAGALGLSEQDERLRTSFEMARAVGLEYDFYTAELDVPHENAVKMTFYGSDGGKLDVVGASLGGGRIVTAYECPGHSAGEMVFLDEQTRSLFAGDAVNFNLGVSECPVETTLRYLKRLRDLGDKYDGIYNGHHDFRALGAPLDGDCLPTAIAILEDALDGHIVPCETPSFWGGDMPLTRGPAKSYNEIAPAMNPGEKKRGKRITLRRGRNFLSIDPDKIRE